MMAALQPLVLMMAGGTGGHVYPALAVANELIERGYRVQWIGTARGLEHRVVPAAGLLLHCLPMRGIRGKSLLHKLLGLVYLALASLQALWLMLRLAPKKRVIRHTTHKGMSSPQAACNKATRPPINISNPRSFNW